MHLGPKSRLVIDLLLSTGLGALEWGRYPTRALMESGGYDHEAHLMQQLARMQSGGWIERADPNADGKWVYRLTIAGQSAATDDIDPEAAWAAKWEGEWHIIAFDLPTRARIARFELNSWLRRRRFGLLQGSVWIAARFEEEWQHEAANLKVNPTDVSFFKGRPFARSRDADFAHTAWNFKRINQAYAAHLAHLKGARTPDLPTWLITESKLWREAYNADPFLPDPLLPANYLGKEAFRQRGSVLSNIATADQ